AHPCRWAAGDGDEAGCGAYLQRNDEVESLDRVQRQSQHGPDAVRPDLRLPDGIPMGRAAGVVFLGRDPLSGGGELCRPSPSFLVYRSFDRGLGGDVALRCRLCFRVCTAWRKVTSASLHPSPMSFARPGPGHAGQTSVVASRLTAGRTVRTVEVR